MKINLWLSLFVPIGFLLALYKIRRDLNIDKKKYFKDILLPSYFTAKVTVSADQFTVLKDLKLSTDESAEAKLMNDHAYLLYKIEKTLNEKLRYRERDPSKNKNLEVAIV